MGGRVHAVGWDTAWPHWYAIVLVYWYGAWIWLCVYVVARTRAGVDYDQGQGHLALDLKTGVIVKNPPQTHPDPLHSTPPHPDPRSPPHPTHGPTPTPGTLNICGPPVTEELADRRPALQKSGSLSASPGQELHHLANAAIKDPRYMHHAVKVRPT